VFICVVLFRNTCLILCCACNYFCMYCCRSFFSFFSSN